MTAHQVISTILRHDRKQNSYKIALLRSIGDIATEFPGLGEMNRDVAIPLRMLSEQWIAYFWPFMDPAQPIWQGHRQKKKSGLSQDVAFRPTLTQLCLEWEKAVGQSRPSDGFFLIHEMRVQRRRQSYPKELRKTYDNSWRQIKQSIKYPIRYAGPGEWEVFERPTPLRKVGRPVKAVPGAKRNELCLIIASELWKTFQELSIWVEALCIHEWSLFTETIDQHMRGPIGRGEVYRLLTDRPDNRRPLTWEHNHIDLLLMEGNHFICPWTDKAITQGMSYDLDHLLPISVYPINELWNLVPSDPAFNQHVKRGRLPSRERLLEAQPRLRTTYDTYESSETLAKAMRDDVCIRFAEINPEEEELPEAVSKAAVCFVERVAQARNLARF